MAQHDTAKQEAAPSPLRARLRTAFTLLRLVPTFCTTALGYSVWGPPHQSWTFRLALFCAISRRYAKIAVEERKHTPTHELKAIEAAQARRKLDAMTPGGAEPGFAVQVEWVVRKRGLGGVLAAMDEDETGGRTLTAEWVTHDSLVSGEQQPSDKIVLYLHGGAYSRMSAKTHRPLCIGMSGVLGCRVFSVDYRLSPEVVFPAALLDAVSAVFYLTEELHIPASNVIVSGDSAGGNLALALMLYLRDHDLAQLGAGILLSPWVDLTQSLKSWDYNLLSDYLYFDRSDPLTSTRLFLGPDFDEHLTSPYVSPALTASLASLPPLLIQAGGAETLVDETTLLAQRADAAGVDTTHEIYEGGVHVFQMIQREDTAPAALRAMGEWARTRPPVLAEIGAREGWDRVGRLLGDAWEKRSAEGRAERRRLKREPAPTRGTSSFVFEPVVEAAPVVRVREGAHEAALKAVEDMAKRQHREDLTHVYKARKV
ncbi:hypothetical protein JCM21900_004130 [Sporobolomyces salmonicolor]